MRDESARVDSFVIFGEDLAKYLAGRVNAAALPPDVVRAFQLQYPGLAESTTFAEHVRDLAGDETALRGFLAGIKGKVFELHAVDYLNEDLPVGWHAELAESATQRGYDIVVYDEFGDSVDVFQVKASAASDLVAQHIDIYPEIQNVIVPFDISDGLAPGAMLHPMPESSFGLDHHVGHAADAARHDPHFGTPVLSVFLTSMQLLDMQRKGRSADEMSEVAVTRLGGAFSAATVSKMLAVLGGPIAIVGAVGARIAWGHLMTEMRESSRLKSEASRAIQRGHRAESAAVDATAQAIGGLGDLAARILRNRLRGRA